ncbi:MAG: metallophosphoesterase [bacterium]
MTEFIKSKYIYLLLPVILVAGYFFISFFLPKYSGQYFIFVVLMLVDIYLWSSIKKAVFNYKKWLMATLSILYWLPFLSLAGFAIGAAIVPVIDWNDPFRTYLLGFIMVFYTAKILPVVFLLLADLIRMIDRLFVIAQKDERQKIREGEQPDGISRSKFLQYMGFISGGLVLGTMFTGMFKWVYQFNVVKEKIRFPNLPKSFDGMKIVQISDMHLGSWTSVKPLEEAVEMINAMDPDLILFTGDLVNFATKEAFRFEETLKKLKAKKGIFATLGNHDYGDYVNWPSKQAKQANMNEMYDLFDRMGWKLMNNKNEIFSSSDGDIALLGVENWGANPRFPKYGDLDKAMAGAENASVRILMTHDPTHWDKIVVPEGHKIDLSLSGHTHGFQFGIETPGLKWSPAKWMYKHWAGMYTDEQTGRRLYVNRGLGVIGYPGRIGILPEITLFELAA